MSRACSTRPIPARTTLMKVATVSTLWDYINRAMPWTAPKSLEPDEVYAVLAYMLNLADVVPDDFTLSDRNIAEVQKRMPNRNGMTHRPRPVAGERDRQRRQARREGRRLHEGLRGRSRRWRRSCPTSRATPHGNLAEQNRQRRCAARRGHEQAAAGHAAAQRRRSSWRRWPSRRQGRAAATPRPGHCCSKNSCTACHAVDAKIVGPAFHDVAKKYAGRTDAVDYLVGKIRSGGTGAVGRDRDAAAAVERHRGARDRPAGWPPVPEAEEEGANA